MAVLNIDAPFQTKYSIDTCCEELIYHLQLKYGKYISISQNKLNKVISVKKVNNIFIVHYQMEECVTTYPLQEIDRIMFDNTEYDDSIFALHGAAVEWKGKAYLFLAPTTSGKTTLASYLSITGFGYITDDCILLDRKNFEIYPYCSPLHLRSGGLAVLKKHKINIPDFQHLDDCCIDRYVYTPTNSITKPIPLAKIFFISIVKEKNRLVKMNFKEKMTQLMMAPITNYNVSSEYIRFISRLASTECCKLFYNDMDYVAKVIYDNEQ